MSENAEVKKLEARAQGMLPGVAGICLFMLVVSLVGVVGVLNGQFPGPGARYGVLPVCTMIVVGVFGLLRLKRWGWALVLGGTLMLSLGYIFMSRVTHNSGLLVMAGLALCFFLYLVRTEVRDRLR
ncbi:hypothetical protein [Granulicella sp. S190]|uniref:hypothetical protein n=1 Tax=Granulicella sp. S190 TaxID=1747226 RepID=UPI00131B7778|nr:hypothetical protein [Granulicella sp. S190]